MGQFDNNHIVYLDIYLTLILTLLIQDCHRKNVKADKIVIVELHIYHLEMWLAWAFDDIFINNKENRDNYYCIGSTVCQQYFFFYSIDSSTICI